MQTRLSAASADLELLEVSLPGVFKTTLMQAGAEPGAEPA